jgi:hypothetical protein
VFDRDQFNAFGVICYPENEHSQPDTAGKKTLVVCAPYSPHFERRRHVDGLHAGFGVR